MSDAQLAAESARLERSSLNIGQELLGADAAYDAATDERHSAQLLLARWAAESYKDGAAPGSMQTVLAGNGLGSVVRRLQVLRSVNEYWVDLVMTLERAEGQLALDPARRYVLVEQLGDTNIRAGLVDAEVRRRAAVAREKLEAAQARQAAAADAARADAAAKEAALGQLASFQPSSGAGGPAVPLVAGPLTAGQLDGYLASKGSPLAGQGAAFMDSGYRWQVDPRLLVAIAGAESNFGNITCGPNNAWGWACPNDPEDFSTWAAGIERVTRGLRKGYLDEGRTRVVLIGQKYCPVGAANDPTGLNNHWVANVSRFLVELGGNPDSVGPGPAPGLMPDIGGIGLGGD